MCDLQLDHIFTYKLITEDNEEELGMREMLYKIQLLQLFKMTEFNEGIMNDKIDLLYEKIKNTLFLKNIFENHPYKNEMVDEMKFRILFSFDYLDLFHKCLYAHFNNLDIQTSLDTLLDNFTSK
jgi:hypothetical protein